MTNNGVFIEPPNVLHSNSLGCEDSTGINIPKPPEPPDVIDYDSSSCDEHDVDDDEWLPPARKLPKPASTTHSSHDWRALLPTELSADDSWMEFFYSQVNNCGL